MCVYNRLEVTQFFYDIHQHYSWQGLSLIVLLVALFCVQFYYYAIAYNRIYTFRLTQKRQKRCEKPHISVIIPLRGENEAFLTDQLPALLHQEYDTYEIVVVYIGGDSDYYEELQRIRDDHSYMRLTKMGGNERIYISTKQALNVGIKSAQYDSLLFTTPDAMPCSEKWIATMAKGFERGSVVIAPAIPHFESNNLRTYLMRIIELHQMRNAMARAVAGNAYYAPRGNYGFNRSIYNKTRSYNYLNIDIGENDLYIQSIANEKRTSVVMSRHSIVSEERPDSWGDWAEYMRYMGSTRSNYPTSAKTFVNQELGSRALFFIVALATIVALPIELKLGAISIVLLRYILVLWSTRRTAKRLGHKNIALKYWIYDLIGPALEWILWGKKSHTTPRLWR